jgi:hypothetical protein
VPAGTGFRIHQDAEVKLRGINDQDSEQPAEESAEAAASS